ncbi:Multimodular transpeptidase-transglycosylase [Rhodovulum sp. PH10]|uniref:transglycosylase domain-containing protein n=1 Tax=Rhodovulum sp. PH10 TaxID=1187851 RepID=UPI00027C2C57|nr:transglycosylase domain-containing protein [Rhodovulum sp. PH10]EJW11116.1 Multimodular transpeptidase-transglycosylase [Rhodovulum sp. PH10]
MRPPSRGEPKATRAPTIIVDEDAQVGIPEPARAAARAESAARRKASAPKSGAKPAGGGGARKSRKKPKKARRGSLIGRTVYWLAVLGLWGVIASGGLAVWVALHLPPIHSLEIPKRPPTVRVVGFDGTLIAARGDMGGSAIALKEMPPYLPQAFIAIEDRRFYSHFGVDALGLVRAVYANVLHRGIAQGGSSITQQLAKNLFLRPERTLMRKLEEVMLALWLEHKLSKREILALYLNRVYFGSGAYGVDGAAQRYFGKSAREVTVSEAALLAGLVKSPSRLAPTRNYDAAERRARLVLGAMAEEGMITDAEAKAAIADPPRIVKPGGGSGNYVADWVMDVLDDVIGQVDDDLVVETSIDPALQILAERAVIDTLTQKGDKYGVKQAALVAMTPDGAVRALVGGKNYQESQFNRAVSAKRQPGSAFKPFVYLTAIERGLTPDTIREDRPVSIRGWKPENYRHKYSGPVTLTQALAHSLNTVSVRLTMEFGPTAVAKTAYRLGIASKLAPNASIALGTSEVSVLELVDAYTPFANGGTATVPHVVERVTAANGRVLYTKAPSLLGRVIEPAYVAMMNRMMAETIRSGTAKGAALPGWQAAGKTGTSQDFRDAWFVGYTAHLVTGVWFGNDDNSPTKRLTGGVLPVEAWHRFMESALQGVQPQELPGLSGPPIAAPAQVPAPMPQPREGPEDVPAAAMDRPVAALGDRSPPRSGGAVQGAPVRPASGAGLDGWFLDRVLGR